MSTELNTTGKLIDQAIKPLINGALCYAGAKAMGYDGFIRLPLVDKGYDAPMALGLCGIVSSFGTELAHNWILPHINQHSKLGQMESMILSPVLNGGIITGLVYAGDSLQVQGNVVSLMGLGAGAEVASTYAFETFARPFLHSKAN
jgi:hypothetical protein